MNMRMWGFFKRFFEGARPPESDLLKGLEAVLVAFHGGKSRKEVVQILKDRGFSLQHASEVLRAVERIEQIPCGLLYRQLAEVYGVSEEEVIRIFC